MVCRHNVLTSYADISRRVGFQSVCCRSPPDRHHLQYHYIQFLAVRSLFGLFIGGVYGNAIEMGLENYSVDARCLMSGILQQGCSLGYVLASCANFGVVRLTRVLQDCLLVRSRSLIWSGHHMNLFP
jgi:hypothetical protein